MAIIKNKNFARKQPECQDGDTFRDCNLSQEKANTEICKGKKGLRFINCNLHNCKLPADAKRKGGLFFQADIEPEPIPPPVDIIQDAINEHGQAAILDKIGKATVKKHFNLTEIKVI